MRNMTRTLLAGILILFMPIMAASAQYSFVVNITSGTYANNQLILNVIPQVTYFSDRPNRTFGHININKFITLWTGSSRRNFRSDPPNAVLSLLTETRTRSVVIELKNAKIQGENVILTIKVLRGNIPARFGSSALYIDDVESSDSIENII